jgi:DNA-binding beta-propeller fold protein YncE
MSYNVITDPSGALLPNINNLDYKYTDVSVVPKYNATYQLRNSTGQIVADDFYPYISPSTGFGTPQPYLARDKLNNIYVTIDNSGFFSSSVYTVAKLINNQFINLNFEIPESDDFTFHPRGIAFDSSGILYITTSTDYDILSIHSRVYKVKITNANTTITQFNISDVSLNDLRGLDFDSSGNLYIADRFTNHIIKVIITDYDNGVGSIYLPNYNGLNGPLDIKFDPYNNAYIANSLENNIIKVTPSNTISIFATGLLYPTEITYNINDSILYVTNYGYLTDLSSNTYIGKIVNGILTNVIQVAYPYGIIATTTGDIYYTSQDVYTNDSYNYTNKLYKLVSTNTSSNYVKRYGAFGYAGIISPITSIAFNSIGQLYASQYNFRLPYYDLDPTFITMNGQICVIISDEASFTYPNSPSDPELNNPTSIAFDSFGNLYVANAASNELIVLDISTNTGIPVTITGVQLSSPSAIVFDGSGKLYIANSISNTICILTFSDRTDASGVYYTPSGSPIISPAGLAFDASYNNLYVSNSGNNNILKIPLSTNVASIYSLYGVNISSPSGIYFDNSSGILYVSILDNNNNNNIIQITNNNTASILNITAGNSNISPNKIIITEPMGLIMDISRNLYISNYGSQNDPIVKISFDISSILIVNTIIPIIACTDVAIQPSNKYIYLNDVGGPVYRLDQFNNLILYTPADIVSGSITYNTDENILYGVYNYNTINSIDSNSIVNNFTITDVSLNNISCIRYSSPNILYVADTSNNTDYYIIQVDIINPTTDGSGSILNITNFPTNFTPYIAFDSSNIMYISTTIDGNTSNVVYKIDRTTSPFNAIPYVTINELVDGGIVCITFDSNNYMYSLCNASFVQPVEIYRTTPDASHTELFYKFPSNDTNIITINYIPWEDTLFMSTYGSQLYKLYLSYPFTNMTGKLGQYDDTLFIYDITNDTNLFDVSFNVYNPYVVIDPSYNNPNVPTDTSFHFLSPVVVPAPTDSYILKCNGKDISNVFCNNCTYNKGKFLAGTYPTGLVYSTQTNYLYVALQNNTISRINIFGIVENDYIPAELGLVGPTSIVLDASFDMFVLNAGSNFISYITLKDDIININNSFFTGIIRPICLIYDIDTNSLYLLSGNIPGTKIIKINANDGSIYTILPIPFGVLYNTTGLTIDAYYGLFSPINVEQPPPTKYLYISNTDQKNNYNILRVNLTNGLYTISKLITGGLTYQPFTMANQNDGYLYVANKVNNSISKISLTRLDPDIQPWAVNGISVPADLCFDNLGDLFVANSGSNPRNSRVSKIYTNYFFFTDVKLANGTCDRTEIWDITTQSYVYIGYYPNDPYIFPIPIPYPIGS